MKRVAVLLAASVCVAGCFRVYEPPTSGDTATLVAKMGELYLYSNEQCDNARRASKRFDFSFDPKVIKVAATGPVFLGSKYEMNAPMMSQKCMSLATFTPVPGATYEVKFDLGSPGEGCALRAWRVSESGEKQVEPLRYFKSSFKCDELN